MASIKLLLNKYRIRRDGTYPLVFQLIHRRQKKLLYTPYKLFPEEFDERTGKIRFMPNERYNRQEVRRMNRELRRLRQSLDRHIETLELKRETYSAADILFRFRIEHDHLSLLHYIDLQIEHKRSMDKLGMVAALQSTRASLAAFLGFRTVRLADMDTAFIREYEEFLVKRGACPNTICFYMRNLKSIYRQAGADGYPMAGNDPFRHMRIKPDKTVKRALERDALRRIAETDFTKFPHLEMARDLFLFCFFCRGMPFVDAIYLKKSNIENGVIGYRRHKTNQWLQIAVTPQLEHLMHKYENQTPYVFPILTATSATEQRRLYRLALERTNRNLKTVARMCDVPISISTLNARHSWATQAKHTGAPIAVISEGLGHTSEKTTRIYLKEFDHRIVDAVNERVSAL